MITSTDIFEFRAKLDKILNSLYEKDLPEEQKEIAIYYLTQVMNVAEQTLKL